MAKRYAALPGEAYPATLSGPGRVRGERIALHWRASEAPRLGLVISRKLAGSAVRRNLVKRQSRGLFVQEACAAGRAPMDLVVRATASLANLDRRTLFGQLRAAFERLPGSVMAATQQGQARR
ncbi:MAG: ribonuclease P protein component [Burkholderiales bacterium]|nr:ribonuclease P protein component [Burkholderiales bacterium]